MKTPLGRINELFIRLNKSKPLTGAELRTAMRGAIPRLLKEVIKHDFFITKVKFNTKRGQDSNVAAKLLLTEFRGKFVDTKKIHLDRLAEDAVKAEISDFSSEIQNIEQVLNYMNDSFITKDPLLTSSGLIPVYYWFYRKHGKAHKKNIRDFLVQFEQKRKDTRKISSINLDLKKVSPNELDYIDFDRLAKSLNDQGSLQGCYNILEKKWMQGEDLARRPILTTLLKNKL